MIIIIFQQNLNLEHMTIFITSNTQMPLGSGACGNAQRIKRGMRDPSAGVMCEKSDNFFRQCPIVFLLDQHAL